MGKDQARPTLQREGVARRLSCRRHIMTEDEPITVWINRLANGDSQAAEVIWRNYFTKLVDPPAW